jgi:hypothetical protein
VIKRITPGRLVKFIKSLQLRLDRHPEKMHNQTMPQQITIAKMKETRKRERPCKRRTDEVEKDLNIMGIIKKSRQRPETVGNGGRLYWKAHTTMDFSAQEE